MNSRVNFEPTGAGVALVAAVEGADEGFLPGVRQLVGLQVTLRNKVLVAAITPEWAFSRVSAHMRLQVPSLRKLFEALHKGTHKQLDFVFRSLHFLNAVQAGLVFHAGPIGHGGLRYQGHGLCLFAFVIWFLIISL